MCRKGKSQEEGRRNGRELALWAKGTLVEEFGWMSAKDRSKYSDFDICNLERDVLEFNLTIN
jgi:hypothetical protein